MSKVGHLCQILAMCSIYNFCVEISTATLNGYFKKVTLVGLVQRYINHDLMNICQYLSVMNENQVPKILLLFQVTGRNYLFRPKLFFNDYIMFMLVVSNVVSGWLVSMPSLVVFERTIFRHQFRGKTHVHKHYYLKFEINSIL